MCVAKNAGQIIPMQLSGSPERCVFRNGLTGGATMRFRTIGFVMLSVAALAISAAAQTPQGQPAVTRTVVAATKLPSVTDQPLLFKALSITISSGEKSSATSADSILYQMSGSTEISIGGETKMLNPGEGLFIAAGKPTSLKAGGSELSTFLHFLLAPVADRDQSVETKPAMVTELYRTAAPISDLKPGSYDLNLTRVHFSRTDAVQPCTSSVRSGSLLHYLGNRH